MTATPILCTSCGAHPSRTAARYCDACGAALPRHDGRAEFKQVTVLFADVVRSMEIAAAVGAERFREIMAEIVGRGTTAVRRYGGAIADFTGDGLMAVFGAPVALEDHALRACLAALEIQQQTHCVAADVRSRDGVGLRLRVGLNSGRVIAGEVGSGVIGFHAIGEQVGWAQRMEAAAPPGAVLLSQSTARLVEHTAVLAEPELVRVKGFDELMPARRLLAIRPRYTLARRAEALLVGRSREVAAVDAAVERAIGGHGSVLHVVAATGVGKSRLAREAAALGAGHGLEVSWAFCESHARDIPFHVVTQLLRAGAGVADLDRDAVRMRLRRLVPDANRQDLLLLEDLLGIADPEVQLPQIDPDARRRRLTALVNSAALTRSDPAVFVIEDVHWIDAVSESMLADFLAVVPRTRSMVLITARPEYTGALARVTGIQTITLAPLDDSDTAGLVEGLLGVDPSIVSVAATIADRAAGNPFFAEEMVRELAQRGVLVGERGDYVCHTDIAEFSVPATVEAAIEARLDRLGAEAKQTLRAAAVLGGRFDASLLAALGIDPALDELLEAELIDQVGFAPTRFAFRHPLIRAVAYEAQLKSDRARWHRRCAAGIESLSPDSADQNATLIAEHLQSAGDLRAAYGWHMRAGAWATHRDIAAARISWERARLIADALPVDEPDRTAMRIAPRTMLCGSAWRVDGHIDGRFDELRQLCALADDTGSLAIGMTGAVMDHMMQGRVRAALELASEQIALLESMDDPALTVGAGSMAILMKYRAGEIAEVLRWSQTVIDWADGDPAKGNLIVGSPLAVALVWRGTARFWLGREGWRQDLDDAVAMARNADPMTYALVVFWKHGWTIGNGVLLADDNAVRELDEARRIAEELSDDSALGLVKYVLGIALTSRDDAADHERGLALLADVRDMCLHGRFYRSELPGLELVDARESILRGDSDGAIPMIRRVLNGFFDSGQLAYVAVCTGFLVEALLIRGGTADVAEAESAIDRAAALPADKDLVLRDVVLSRLRAMLARARGDEDGYRAFRDRYRDMTGALGFEGHAALAQAMT